MTLPLRKKRQTTRRNIAKRLISAGLAALVAITSAAHTSAALAEGNWNTPAPSKLSWRPARSTANDTTIIQAVDVSPVRTAKYEEDVFEETIAAPARIQLNAPTTTAIRTVSNDVFDDNLPSVQTRKTKVSSRTISATNEPPVSDTTQIDTSSLDTLPPVAREVPPMLQIDSVPAQREPAELSPPNPLKSGALRHTVQTNQQVPDPFTAPSPEAPGFGNPVTQRTAEENCKIEYDKIRAITLNKLSIDISVNGRTGTDVPNECGLSTDAFQPRCWRLTTYTWKASALCHKPLYFEDEALERYGHSHGPVIEYGASAAHFFGDVALLPYHIGVETPCECIYDLGVYRPGNCAPYMLNPFPFSLRGACTAAAGYCGVIALFP